jgi:hypothetical protein
VTGLLDESFFMYGEDIDLSYRIILAGYRNYYFPETTIIHYKGESTRKGSINYVVVFYQAMIIFARKHFSTKNARLFTLLITLAVWFRASLAILSRFIKKIARPVADLTVMYLGFLLMVPAWEQIRFGGPHFPDTYLLFAVPVYLFTWMIANISTGVYRQPVSQMRLLRGLSYGTLAILVFYSLLNEEYRFSRALILAGFFWGIITLPVLRWIGHWLHIPGFTMQSERIKRVIIVAGEQEAERIKKMLPETGIRAQIAGTVNPLDEPGTGFIGHIGMLHEIVRVNNIDEILFSAKDVSSQEIIRQMHTLSDIRVDFKIAPQESISVIGSNSIDTAGDLYVVDNNSIVKESNRRKKRILDLMVSFTLLITSPVWLITRGGVTGLYQNIRRVISGHYSWVGYVGASQVKDPLLPEIRPGILSPADLLPRSPDEPTNLTHLNLHYSRNYHPIRDLRIIWYARKFLGRVQMNR